MTTEYEECEAFYELCLYHPILKTYIFHIPNEGKRTFSYYKSLEKIGFRKGLPDYFLAYPNDSWHGLFIEMKRSKTFKRDPNQEEWLDNLTNACFYASYAFSAENAYKICIDYLNNVI